MVDEEESVAEEKYEILEDLPGIGPTTAGKLKELGFHTIESVAMATARELVSAGIGEKKALLVISAARSSMNVSFVRVDELLKKRQNVLRLVSGVQQQQTRIGNCHQRCRFALLFQRTKCRPLAYLNCLIDFALTKECWDVAAYASSACDKSFGVLFKCFVVDAWFVIKTVLVGVCHELA